MIMDEMIKVLIVDDIEANRYILKNVIFDMGHFPILAENGMQALKIVQRMKPELIILDIAAGSPADDISKNII